MVGLGEFNVIGVPDGNHVFALFELNNEAEYVFSTDSLLNILSMQTRQFCTINYLCNAKTANFAKLHIPPT